MYVRVKDRRTKADWTHERFGSVYLFCVLAYVINAYNCILSLTTHNFQWNKKTESTEKITLIAII